MKILVDQEGKNVIRQLCDIALKQGGVSNLNQVNLILRSVNVLPTPVVKEDLQPKSFEEENEAKSPDDAEKKEVAKEIEEPKEEVAEELKEIEEPKESRLDNE